MHKAMPRLVSFSSTNDISQQLSPRQQHQNVDATLASILGRTSNRVVNRVSSHKN